MVRGQVDKVDTDSLIAELVTRGILHEDWTYRMREKGDIPTGVSFKAERRFRYVSDFTEWEPI